MIIVRIKGGLGNQMFQYALGRSLSLKTGLPLVLDKRHYLRVREHGYGLDKFQLADTPMDAAKLPPAPRATAGAFSMASDEAPASVAA